MKHRQRILLAAALLLLAAAGTFAGCSKRGGEATALNTETDSVAYILGMNIGRNLWQMDSTLNVRVVCEGLADYFARNERMTVEEAQAFYLNYVNVAKPEHIREYEDRYLEDIRRNNRSYARTKTGVTYTVGVIGDESLTPRNSTDTVSIRYVARTVDGRVFHSSFERGDTTRTALSALPEGLRESLTLIGKGGHIDAYVPARLGYGAEGNDSLGVKPNATLYYEIDLLDMERPGKNGPSRSARRASLDL